jgi:hypothetical protein
VSHAVIVRDVRTKKRRADDPAIMSCSPNWLQCFGQRRRLFLPSRCPSRASPADKDSADGMMVGTRYIFCQTDNSSHDCSRTLQQRMFGAKGLLLKRYRGYWFVSPLESRRLLTSCPTWPHADFAQPGSGVAQLLANLANRAVAEPRPILLQIVNI